MATDFKLPEMGEGVNEGELVRFLVKEGDVVKHDQPLVEMMTDKATVEIPSPTDGKVLKLVAKEGDMIKVGQTLMQMEEGSSSVAAAPAKSAPAPMAAAAAPASAKAPTSSVSSASAGTTGMAIYPPPAGANVLATPSTRRYAREAGVDINNISVIDINGRVVKNQSGDLTQINVSDLNAGVYFVTIEAAEGKTTKKFIKQ